MFILLLLFIILVAFLIGHWDGRIVERTEWMYRLPMTLDGETVADGDPLYREGVESLFGIAVKSDAYWIDPSGQHLVDSIENFYSTDLAAKNANLPDPPLL